MCVCVCVCAFVCMYVCVCVCVCLCMCVHAGNYGRNDTTLGGQGGGLLLAAPATPVAARVPVIVQRSNFYQNYARVSSVCDTTFDARVIDLSGTGAHISSARRPMCKGMPK